MYKCSGVRIALDEENEDEQTNGIGRSTDW